MSSRLVAALVLALLLPGCVDTLASGSQPSMPGATLSGDSRGAPAPTLVPGQSFTFQTTGLYDGEQLVTVVVAQAREQGYLLAGASPEDLPTAIAWGRWYLGPVDTELNPVDPGSGERTDHPFDFPLENGKSWRMGGGNVTVRATPVPAPQGTAPGYEMRWGYGRGNVTWTYAPSVGFLTEYVWEDRGRVVERARLVATAQASTWTWYEEVTRFSTGVAPGGVPTYASAFRLPSSADALVVSVGATPGGSVLVAPPATTLDEPFTFAPTEEAWATRILTPHDGRWSLGSVTPQEGYAFAELVAVTWVRGSP